MSFHSLCIFIFVQCLINKCLGNVENTLRGKILFSNQDLIEDNREYFSSDKDTILSRDEIFNFLKQFASTSKDVERMKELLERLGPREVRHIDFLIYLMGYYKHLIFLKAIKEILTEDEKTVDKIMQNLG